MFEIITESTSTGIRLRLVADAADAAMAVSLAERHAKWARDYAAMRASGRLVERSTAASWILRVGAALNMTNTVAAHAVALFDEYVAMAGGDAPWAPERIQLYACAALLVASKFHADSNYLDPTILCIVSRDQYVEDQICDAEVDLVTALNWNLWPLTACDYLDIIDMRDDLRRTAAFAVAVMTASDMCVLLPPLHVALLAMYFASRSLDIAPGAPAIAAPAESYFVEFSRADLGAIRRRFTAVRAALPQLAEIYLPA